METEGGRYLREDTIGRGGLGEVFRAHDTQLNRWVAIKRLHHGEGEAKARDTKVIQEARHLAALNHPNIVTVYDFIEDKGDLVVVMELLRGRTLQEIAEKAPLLLKDFSDFVRQTLEGLIAAHSIGMLHRDIKPSNIMLVDLPSGTFQVKILDFGLAKIVPEPSLQTMDQGGGIMGSVFTMAPEQLEGRHLEGRTDLYSLGCVAYFALTTHYPFTGATIPEVICAHLQQRRTPLKDLRPDLPDAVCEWVEKLMNVDPGARPATAVKALEEYQGALEGKSPLPAGTVKPATTTSASAPAATPMVEEPKRVGRSVTTTSTVPVRRVNAPLPPPTRKLPRRVIAVIVIVLTIGSTAAALFLQPASKSAPPAPPAGAPMAKPGDSALAAGPNGK